MPEEKPESQKKAGRPRRRAPRTAPQPAKPLSEAHLHHVKEAAGGAPPCAAKKAEAIPRAAAAAAGRERRGSAASAVVGAHGDVEAHPFAKTGGLAEVSASLTDALGAVGPRRHARAPALSSVSVDGAERLQTRVALGDRLQPRRVLRAPLVGPRDARARRRARALRSRGALRHRRAATIPTTPLRFAVFSRAALEYPRLREQRPSIIHAHDWQAGLVPVYQKMQLLGRSVRRRRARRLHDPQPGVSGRVSRRDAAGDRPRLRGARRSGRSSSGATSAT